MRETICGHQIYYAKGLCYRCYSKIPKIKAQRKKFNNEYNQRPEVKMHKRIYQMEYQRLPETKKKIRGYIRKYHLKNKIIALNMLGGARCIYCGCDDMDFLEINHKDGGGRHDTTIYKIYQHIAKGKRKTNDLEVTCRVCNALHYLKMKNPQEAMRFNVIWSDVNRSDIKKEES